MRLCRFLLDDLVLIGFYADDRLIPIDQAAEAYEAADDIPLEWIDSDDLLDWLPPSGRSFRAARILADWLDDLDPEQAGELGISIDDATLLTPIRRPGKILALAGNYAAHVAERGGSAAERNETFPYVFMKPITALTHPGAPIVLPAASPDHIDWECELGVVIGKRCKNVDEMTAPYHIAGYTVINDVSDRRFRPNPDRKPRERDKFFDWLHGKWHDTFCPVGPCVLSSDKVADPRELSLRLTVNGETKQAATAAEMVFPVGAIVSFLSGLMTLEPGDLIATGTPSGVGSSTGTYLKAGDLVAATVEGIGSLINPVVAENRAGF